MSRLRVERIDVDAFWLISSSSIYAPALVVVLSSERSVEVQATWRLGADARERLVAALRLRAAQHGVAVPFRPDDLHAGEPGMPPRPSIEVLPGRSEADEPQGDGPVACVACGRSAPSNEMWAFGEEGGALGWFCRDEDACERRAAARAG